MSRVVRKEVVRKEVIRKEKPDKYVQYSRASLGAVAAAFFIGVTAVFPLYISRLGYTIITKQKADFFVALTAAAGVLAFLAFFLTTQRFRLKDYFTANEPERPVLIHEWAFLVFILLALASAILSPWQDFVWHGYTSNGINGRWEGFWVYLCYFLTFVIISRLFRPRRLYYLIFAGSVVLLSLYGVLQYLGTDILETSGFLLFPGGHDPIGRAFRVTLGNINVVSGYCSLVIPLFAALYAGEDSKWGLGYLLASSMSFALLCITRGDAGRVGVLAGMVLMIPYWIADRRRLGKILIALSCWSAVSALNQAYLSSLEHFWGDSRQAVIFGAAAAVLLAAGLALILAIKKWPAVRFMKIAGAAFLALSLAGGLLFVEMEGRRREGQSDDIIWEAREMLHGRMDDSFGSDRGQIWRLGMSVVMDNPLLGTGPDTFYFALGGRQITPAEPTEENPFPEIVRADGLQLEAIRFGGVVYDKAHNLFLQIAVCMGIPALLAFLIFLGGLFFTGLKKAFDRPILLAFAAAAISYLAQSFFQIDTPIDRPLLYAALGVMSGEIWRGKVGA